MSAKLSQYQIVEKDIQISLTKYNLIRKHKRLVVTYY